MAGGLPFSSPWLLHSVPLSRWWFLVVLAPLALSPLAPSATAQTTTGVPIQEVVFFKSGVHYVEHRGRVSGAATMTLRFPTEQMKDVLK